MGNPSYGKGYHAGRAAGYQQGVTDGANAVANASRPGAGSVLLQVAAAATSSALMLGWTIWTQRREARRANSTADADTNTSTDTGAETS